MDDIQNLKISHLETKPFSLYIVSGGVGSSGEQLARTVLAQFPGAQVDILIIPKVNTKKQVRQVLEKAQQSGAVIAHTFVDAKLRSFVKHLADDMQVASIDLVGPLMENLGKKLDQEPLGKPGLYRQLYRSYFERIAAMDFTLDHDDGKNPAGWLHAEIILLGVSRVGKTPISLYLSILGWKVANIPLVSGITPKGPISELNHARMVGLTISPGELVEHRRHRQIALGLTNNQTDYTDPLKVYEEIEEIERFFRRNRISVIDVTAKPIETSADEILKLVRWKLKRGKKN
jgi:regulator of PEP synthase PpsR (kinase-PPPase family)